MAKLNLGKQRYDVISTCGIFRLGKPYIYGSGSVRVNKWVVKFVFHANNLFSRKIASETHFSLFPSKKGFFVLFNPYSPRHFLKIRYLEEKKYKF